MHNYAKFLTAEEREALSAASGETMIKVSMSRERIVLKFADGSELPFDMKNPLVIAALLTGNVEVMIGQHVIGAVGNARIKAAGIDLDAVIARANQPRTPLNGFADYGSSKTKAPSFWKQLDGGSLPDEPTRA
jgi:hypothetical protein